MALTKNEIPILEYDTEPKAILMPNRDGADVFPSKAVFPFLSDEIERYVAANQCEKIGEYETITKTFPIYKTVHKGNEICLCQAPLGSSAAVQLLDFLIGCGVREIISTGSCGALIDLPENAFLLPTEALRDEGASYHYLPPKRTVKINEKAVEAIQSVLNKMGIAYQMCQTWTTDGIYRETADMVQYRREEGYVVVEMECAGLAACAEFRGAVFGQILFTADTLADIEAHDGRGWGYGSHAMALNIAIEAVCELNE